MGKGVHAQPWASFPARITKADKIKMNVPTTTTEIKRPQIYTNSTRDPAAPQKDTSTDCRYFLRTNKKIMNAVTDRFLMWVDAVGGYLVCLNDQLTIGQARPNSHVEIPLAADIASQHARLKRQGKEGDYVLEPLSQVMVQHQEINSPTLLYDGDMISLGSAQLQFTKPHPLSASARLDLIGSSRTNPYTDAILLMSDTLIIGNNMANHVVYHGEDHQVVLYQQDGKLLCRSNQPVNLDGIVDQRGGELFYGSQVKSDLISFSLEEVP